MGLLKTAATVAVASSVHGRIQRRQQNRWARGPGHGGCARPATAGPRPATAGLRRARPAAADQPPRRSQPT